MSTVDIDAAKAARNFAYRLLRIRPRSESEIRKRLAEKRYRDGLIDEVIGALREKGYLDDGKFARFWIESRMHLNPVGDAVLKDELRRKGVAGAVIDGALVEKAAAYDEHAIALAMASERFARLKKLDRRKAAKRLYDFLGRRGFAYDLIRTIIEELTQAGYED